jgi:putative DNA primase/helicase
MNGDIGETLDQLDSLPGIAESREQRQREMRHLRDAAELRVLGAIEDPIERARQTKALAKKLGVPIAVVRETLARLQRDGPKAERKMPQWAPSEVWPDEVNGQQLIADLMGAIHRFVMLDEMSALVAALWILFTWAFEGAAETNPFLRIISPTPACGKSTLLKVLLGLCRSAWIVARISPSAFARALNIQRRTMLLDEGDAFLRDNEVMRNVLDGASDPDTATISLSVKSGDDWKPISLDVFVPIAIASIGPLRSMRTVESRAIAVHLKRATPPNSND